MIKDRTHAYLASGRGWYQRDPSTITKITVHHTAGSNNGSEDQILSSIFGVHNGTNGWPGISYHYIYIPERFSGHSGKVIKLNNDEDVTWHDGVNWDSIGFCIHGYYHPDVNHTLTDKDLTIIKEFLDYLCTQNPQFPADFNDVFGHRDRGQTACPGNYLYPYVTEYRTSGGDVEWGGDTDNCVELAEQLAYEKTEKEKYKTEARNLRKEVEELEKELDNMTKDRNKYSQEVAKLSLSIKAMQESHTLELRAREEHIESLQTSLAESNQQLATAVNQSARLEKENEVNKKLAEARLILIAELEAESNGLEKALFAEIEKTKDLKKQLADAKKKALSSYSRLELLKALFNLKGKK